MTEFYTINSEYALARHDLYLGQVLAVEYVDRVWYRGRIAGFPGDQKVTPFFCFVFFFHFVVPFFLALFFFLSPSFFCVSLVQCLRDPSFTESYRVLPSFWRCFFFKFSGHFQRSALVILVLPNLTEFYRVYLGVFEVDIFIFGLFSRQCSSDPSFTDSYRVLPSFTEFLTLHLLFSSHFQRSFTCFT